MKRILTDIVCWQQQRTTHSRIHVVLTLRQAQERCPRKILLPQPGRNQALNFRENVNSVYHNRRAPHTCVTAHNLLHIKEVPVKLICQIDARIIPSKINQEPELRPHIMQDRKALSRKSSMKPFTWRVTSLLHSSHDRPVYTAHATKTDKPDTVQI